MSDGKHTPGPWQQAHRMTCNGRGFWNTEVFCAKGETIATISWYPMPTTPGGVTSTYREANARLIAAAPDLLAAAREVVAYYEPIVPGHIRALVEAIAKAKEGTPA